MGGFGELVGFNKLRQGVYNCCIKLANWLINLSFLRHEYLPNWCFPSSVFQSIPCNDICLLDLNNTLGFQKPWDTTQIILDLKTNKNKNIHICWLRILDLQIRTEI